MAMDYRKVAVEVIEKVGGKENVISVMNCVTRLRFVLKDESRADDEGVKSIPGVKGMVRQGGQYQVIIGTTVAKVAEEAADILGKELGSINTVEKEDLKKKESLFNAFFKTVSGCILPFMGLMIASGMIRGILTLLVAIGAITNDSGVYQLLYAGADAVMYFMPILIGFSAGKQFGTNPFLTAAVGAALVYPGIVSLYNDEAALKFLGIPVVLTSYANTIFPILLASWATAKIEKFWKKVIPDIISMMFVPFLTLIIIIPLTFLAIGPVMNTISNVLADGTQTLWGFSPIVAGVILGAFWQVIIIFGLHYAFIPILINNIATNGVDPINAVLGMTVMALVGSGLGYALKQKNKEKKVEGLTCSLTACLGVTEPMIYSIALPEKIPFLCAFIGGGLAGGVLAASGAAMQGFANGGIFQTFMMISPTDPMNIRWFFICSAIAIVVSAVLSFIFTKSEDGK